MNVIQVISEHKKTKRNPKQVGLYHCRIGLAECIVEENGLLKTRHCSK